MKIKAIKYIGFYDVAQNGEENRGYSLAAITKMNYICDVLNKIGYEVLIISPSRTKNNRFYNGKTIQINKHTSLKLFPTFPWGNKLQKAFSLVASDIMLFWYLLTQVKRNEAIMVYHSLGLRGIVRFAKKVRGFKVVLEVEEIYQDVMSYSKYTMKNEYKTIAIADKYIFPTELLNEKLNISNKPYTIIYGTYKVEEHRNYKFEDDKIHVVYAGTFDPRKGGALAAAAAAEYLSNRYHVHIIGFGSKEQIEYVKDTIKEVSKKTEAAITYDGLLKGEEYITFLQKCDIGLSTQMPGATFNVTSFPSKILSYMANGLRVVSVRIEAIEKSAVGNAVYYYEEQTPESIAEAIDSIDLNEIYDSRELIRKLDVDFAESLRKLLEV
ncbi:glycosyltransferase [Acetoanaerobium noterae]|uniref:glycosyltransferase n=1 Tax=Acetoanaerobium noterae TaxID=745369 RepID=UPI0028A8E8E7|nr:glycosyltransferase [Acetoanaerobium noterae]